jgi:hypothetical protein
MGTLALSVLSVYSRSSSNDPKEVCHSATEALSSHILKTFTS